MLCSTPWHLGVREEQQAGSDFVLPSSFHPESSKQFTDQDSSFLSAGPRPSAGMKRGLRALVFLDQGSGGAGWGSESPGLGWPPSLRQVKLDCGLQLQAANEVGDDGRP